MEDYIEVNRKTYDSFAKHLKDRHLNPSDYEMSDEEWKKFLSQYLTTDTTILEIGPGVGRILKIFEELGCRTIAVELSEKMCKYTQEYSPKSIIINDDIKNVNFIENSFDIIFAGALIHNFPSEDAKIVLAKMKKWIKETGFIIIHTTIHDIGEEGFFEKVDYEEKFIRFRKKYTKKGWFDLINSLNLKIINEFFTDEKDRQKLWIVSTLKK